ncbi:MAG: adenosylcobalamin-dependent ribonucleoside-diphosphate reductase [Burkholderiales bacterium]
MLTSDLLLQPHIARLVWESKYRWRDAEGHVESGIEETWRRIARALACAESTKQELWANRFYEVLSDFRFLPGGRVLAGAGTDRRVTLFNCFVMGTIEDTLPGIFQALKEGAITMQQGGGVGYDFSSLRPAGSAASESGQIASGPVSFLRVWDAMCATLVATSIRRGAMMATLRCDHPDIEAFIDAKRDPGALPHFNLSVLVSDRFMDAVSHGVEWRLTFRSADGRVSVGRWIDARKLWDRMMHAAYDSGEPGVIFIDRVRREDNLQYCETIVSTNPCGEVPLPPYGVCDLGSINLTRFVHDAFTPRARLDLAAVVDVVPIAVRMLDNVYDVSRYPLLQQRQRALSARRIGLGITGLADALTMLGLRYWSDAALQLAGGLMRTIAHAAYHASVALAQEKGAFPAFSAEPYLSSDFATRLPPDLRDSIAAHGMRNSHLTAIAPAGTISLLAGNVSSGIEPAYGADFQRRVRIAGDAICEVEVTDYACGVYRQITKNKGRPPDFLSAHELTAEEQLSMQSALQPHVDNAVSKTLNLPCHVAFDEFSPIFERAYALGLKGCTAYRAIAGRGAVLRSVAHPMYCEVQDLQTARDAVPAH